MNFNDLLQGKNINPEHVIALRHRPYETQLNKVIPWLATTRPDLFNAYQQAQGVKLEKVMQTLEKTGYIASFIGRGAGKALFVGLYAIKSSTPITYDEYWKITANIELKRFGMVGFQGERKSILWFDLALIDFYNYWKGKLIVNWPPPERSWWRRVHRNNLLIHAIHEHSILEADMPEWDTINFSWEELRVLPTHWKSILSQWRGIYYIFDTSNGKGYVGSAYGKENILGRWLNYSVSGHGGNRLLRKCNPQNFQFTILQRVSPDISTSDIIQIENTWKERLHTREPYGLNNN
ncbi:MAG: GIY-YIG nuclease family protein [Anaerolineales bacterium]|nr:GIY-YIG nuclease family protein [Anaerolineales bacterium]